VDLDDDDVEFDDEPAAAGQVADGEQEDAGAGEAEMTTDAQELGAEGAAEEEQAADDAAEDVPLEAEAEYYEEGGEQGQEEDYQLEGEQQEFAESFEEFTEAEESAAPMDEQDTELAE